VNLYRYFGDKMQNIFSEEDFRLYREVRQKVQLTIAEAFGISASSLHLTKPTFFSRINSTEARTAHDEYWHAHVDKVTYGSFDYTSLLYLSNYLEDFGGGRFVFMEEGANKTVEPRAVVLSHLCIRGRVWTSSLCKQEPSLSALTPEVPVTAVLWENEKLTEHKTGVFLRSQAAEASWDSKLHNFLAYFDLSHFKHDKYLSQTFCITIFFQIIKTTCLL
ncbi:OGFOD3 isoform 9, partial [Pan troglodytes]